MMGSGKSSVGRALARRTGWPFLDNDHLLERATGRTARQLLVERGVEAMRDAESAALAAGLAAEPPVIIGVAAGVVLDEPDRDRVSDGGVVVWLDAAPEVLAARSVGAEHRPWLEDDPVGWFRTNLALREPLYTEVADLRVDTGATTPDQAAGMIASALQTAQPQGPIPSGP